MSAKNNGGNPAKVNKSNTLPLKTTSNTPPVSQTCVVALDKIPSNEGNKTKGNENKKPRVSRKKGVFKAILQLL